MNKTSIAFGTLGIEPRWTSSAKDGVGTAYHSSSRVWFTHSHGIINEIYFPHVDSPNTRDLQFLITDGESFCHEERRDLLHQTEYPEPNTLFYRLTNSDREGRYRLVKEIVVDPHSSVLLMHTRLEILDPKLRGKHPARNIVGGDFLQLVRLGVATMPGALRYRRRIGNKSSMDRSETKAACGRVSVASRGILCLLVGLLWASGLRAQSPEEHARHHPGQAAGGTSAPGAMPAGEGSTSPAALGSGSRTSAAGVMPEGGAGAAPAATPGSADGMGGRMGGRPGRAGPPEGVGGGPSEGVGGGPPEGAGGAKGGGAKGGGMMGGGEGGGMGGMMEKMGAPKPKDFYPTLMDLPDLPLDKRVEVEQQADERMRSGVALMNESLDQLLQAASAENYTAMQAGSASLREGLARFESGLAAKRALAEGKAPRNVALTWFKREMNIAYPMPSDEPRAMLGTTPLHLFSMVLLVLFALVMVALYFVKMRRAAALFERIEANKGAPPPGAAPALAGGPLPPAAPADKPAADAKGTST